MSIGETHDFSASEKGRGPLGKKETRNLRFRRIGKQGACFLAELIGPPIASSRMDQLMELVSIPQLKRRFKTGEHLP